MYGAEKGLVGQTYKACENLRCLKSMAIVFSLGTL